jgi:putative redox protein
VAKPPVIANLHWLGDLRFRATSGDHEWTIDGKNAAGPSPVDALAMAVAGCMAIDVADIVVKGRHDLSSLDARITGERREEPPRYFVRFALHFTVVGEVPAHAVERAIQLSRDKYCSVWHSIRPDTELVTTFEVNP